MKIESRFGSKEGGEGWVICSGREGLSFEPAMNGCRDYECCLGKFCGFTFEECKKELIEFYRYRLELSEKAETFEDLNDISYWGLLSDETMQKLERSDDSIEGGD